MNIMEALPEGRQNAISARTLAGIIGCNNTRKLRTIVHKARADGAVICSCQNGYYKPATATEIENLIKYLSSHSASTFAALRSAKKALDSISGQECMEGC